jgi:prepilin-type N-terminal cleavage/methylation domain-containing protein
VTPVQRDDGFTLIETLVAIALFSMLSAGFYSVMFSGVRASDTARAVVRISEEARLGLNRMIRDTRETEALSGPSPTSFRTLVDFNGNGLYVNDAADGNYEDLTFAYDGVRDVITLNGEDLIAGVEPIGSTDIFAYTSNHLELDTNADGVASSGELDQTANGGNGNGTLDGPEIDYVSAIEFTFQIRIDGRTTPFHSRAQLRNER